MSLESNRQSASSDAAPINLGTATFAPLGPVMAGSNVTWTIVHTVGPYGIDDGGSLLLTVRQMCDWGTPQWGDPAAANYVTAVTNASATLRLSWNRRGHLRPWRQALAVMVVDGHLAPGDQVTITLGDRSGGGPGLRAQTFVEECFALRLFVDPSGSHQYDHVTDLAVPVIAGPAVGLALVGPSTAVAGEPSWLHLRAHDAWGNVAESYTGQVVFEPDPSRGGDDSLPQSFRFTPEDRGIRRFEDVILTQPGIARLTVRDDANGFTAISNPCRVVGPDETAMRLYWGDLHGQSGETVGSGDAAAYWDFLHHASGAEYGAHCGNDFQITPEFYRRLRSLVQEHHDPGRFVTFLAYEWSANHPAGGDHNVYFLHDDPERSNIHRSGHWLLDEPPDDGEERHPLSALREEFRGRDDVLILPHIGGRRANLDMLDDVRQSPIIEISSIHGRFPWFARDALERGLKVGFIAGSDDHCGRPGVAPPSTHDLVVPGGLSAIYAPELTREALWAGLRARHCYGSSGARIIVRFVAGDHLMGSECVTSDRPRFQGVVHGTAPIATIELRRDLEIVWTLDELSAPPPDWSQPATRAHLRLAWSGANSKNRPKVAHWDGGLTLTGGRILGATPYNLGHPEEGLTGIGEQAVTWTSHTSGEEDGVWLDLEVTPDASLNFSTPVLRQTIPLNDIGGEPLVIPAGGVDLQLELRWVREAPGPLDIEWSWTDENPLPGEHAYWLWVTQRDGEAAWSSPIFITYSEAPNH